MSDSINQHRFVSLAPGKTDSRNTCSLIALVCLLAALLCGCSLKERKAELLYRQGSEMAAEGWYDEATEKFKASMELARETGNRAGEAHNQNEIGIVLFRQGQYEQARERFRQGLKIYSELEMAPEISKTMNNMANTYLRENRFDKALEQYTELLKWDWETDNYLGEGITMTNMGLIHETHYQAYRRGLEFYTRALKVFEEHGYPKHAARVRALIKRTQNSLASQ